MRAVLLTMLIDDLELLIGFLWKYQEYWRRQEVYPYEDVHGKERLYLTQSCLDVYNYVFADCLLLLFLK